MSAKFKNDFFEDQKPPKAQPPKITVIKTPQTTAPLPPHAHTGRRIAKILTLIVFLLVLGLGGFLLVRGTNIANQIFVGEKTSFYNKVSQLVKSATGRDAQLKGESDNQINILLLGIGGEGHDGSYLSDTIILAQIKPEDKKASLTSIPRDYLADLGPISGQRKINAAFAEGFAKNKDWNEAGKASIKAVEKISGLTIPYFAVVDFKGFEEAIDVIGGVDINVDRTFTDYTFPNKSDGYLPAQTFTAGLQHMNGNKALIYARSRHAAGPEGSDFARSVRQQKVIQATKEKVVTLNLVTDSGKLNQLLSVLGNHFHTNIQLDEMLHLYTMSKDFSSEGINSRSLDPSTGLICPQILESNGAYVLSPCNGKKASDIQKFFADSFSGTTVKPAVVWLADSTVGQKNYSSASKQLSSKGLTVYQISFSGKPLSQTVFYSVNEDEATSQVISEQLKAKSVSLPPPGVKIDKDKVDIVIILGNDFKPQTSGSN
jgi:LCP family protein required for cell wall assembly